jgi:hypothetical protein
MEVSSIDNLENRSIAEITFKNKKDPSKVMLKNFTVIRDANKNLTCFDKDIVMVKDIKYTKEIEKNINVTVKKQYFFRDGFAFLMSLDNKSDLELDLQTNNECIYAVKDGNLIAHKNLLIGSDKYEYFPQKDPYKIMISFMIEKFDHIGMMGADGKAYTIY